MEFDPNKITVFAKTDARGQNVPFGIKALDRGRHMYVIGKTGMGKSTLLENMAAQDLKNGEGMAFIDPHGATAETLLDYIPEDRKDDVLYFAPFDAEHPVAFNVMEDVGPDKRHLVVSGLMSVFKKIWVDAWSARMEYILQNTLLALLEYPDSTLLGVNRMLSEKNYRKKVIDNITDPAVKSFWVDEFLNYNERYMQEAGDAIKNKIGQFTANPLIRNIIGQPKSSFDIRQMMDERKIIIMNLSKGLVGESNANLLGSMLTTRIYLAAMSRADLSQEKMRVAPNFYFYVDEFQSFANATFADILSEARKYKLNLTIAHQYIEQMEEEVRNAVFGNVGTIVSFRVGPFDAEVLETIFAPKFFAVDICNLGFAQVYLTLMIDGIGSAPFSAVTLPPLERTSMSCKDMVIHRSRQQFSKPRAEVEAAIVSWLGQDVALPTKSEGAKASSQKDTPKRYNDGRPTKAPSESRKRGDTGGTRDNSSRTPQSERLQRDSYDRSDKKPTKQLDDLRSVLAGMVNKDSAEAKSATEKQSTSQKSEAKTAASTPGTQSVTKVDKSTADSASDLKSTLASMLANQTAASPADQRQEKKSESVPQQEKQSQLKQRDLETQSSKPARLTQSEGKPLAPPADHVVPVQTTAERSDEKQKDPFDPKVLERMMRVKTGDKSPLK